MTKGSNSLMTKGGNPLMTKGSNPLLNVYVFEFQEIELIEAHITRHPTCPWKTAARKGNLPKLLRNTLLLATSTRQRSSKLPHLFRTATKWKEKPLQCCYTIAKLLHKTLLLTPEASSNTKRKIPKHHKRWTKEISGSKTAAVITKECKTEAAKLLHNHPTAAKQRQQNCCTKKSTSHQHRGSNYCTTSQPEKQNQQNCCSKTEDEKLLHKK
ncbi:hypothetical protein U1Q18_001957 [Sarracenia purpurea var. burkii]